MLEGRGELSGGVDPSRQSRGGPLEGRSRRPQRYLSGGTSGGKGFISCLLNISIYSITWPLSTHDF